MFEKAIFFRWVSRLPLIKEKKNGINAARSRMDPNLRPSIESSVTPGIVEVEILPVEERDMRNIGRIQS
jgi:hypothetical protein